jgi:uroporphyrinogen decarboxylase
MTSRERVLAALNHEEPDRVPIDLAGKLATSINIGAYSKLKNFLRIDGPVEIASLRSMIARVDDRVLEYYGVDTRALPLLGNSRSLQRTPDGGYQDEWGVVRRQAEPNGHFMDTFNPLAGAQSIDEIANHPWPDPEDPGYTDGLAQAAEMLHRNTDYAVILTLPVGPGHLAQWLRGYENWMVDLAANREFYQALMDKVTELWCRISQRMILAAGPNADILFWGDDVAYQDGPMLKHETYVRYLRPYHEQICKLLHTHGAKIVYHSCGSVVSLIDDFIDLGIDALNPIQVSAAGMDTAMLKRRFGKRIAFWGGGACTQRVLPSASPAAVRADVRRRIRDLAPGGGYIFAAVHNIQREVPPENADAMFDEAMHFGRYPIPS